MESGGEGDGSTNLAQAEAKLSRSSDLNLARKALAGSPEARRDFVEKLKCVPKILCVINARMGSPLGRADLEDLSQEVLIAIWRRLPDYEGTAALTTWCYRFCQFTLMAHLRKMGSRGASVEFEEEKSGSDEDELLRIRYDHVYRALDLIDSEEAKVIRLKHFGAHSFDEIGKLLSMPSSTVKANYYRAIDRLREILARDETGVAL